MEATALFDFQASNEDELSFRKGEILNVVNMDVDENWYKAELGGRSGMIPKNYVNMENHSWFMGKISRLKAEEYLKKQTYDGAFLLRISESDPKSFSLSVKFQNAVQHFKVLKQDSKYFLWVVKFESLNKLVEHHRKQSVSRTETILLKDPVSQNKMTVIAVYDFYAQDDTELTFKKGDRILVLDNKSDKNWWRGKLNGIEGYFPSNYIRE